MFGAIAGGIASALAGGAMSKLFGGGQKAASGGFFFSSSRRHTSFDCDWNSDVCSSDLSSPFHFRANRCFWISRGVRREGMSGPPGLIREGGRQEQAFQEHFDEEDGEDHEDRGEVDPAEIGRASCREKREGYSG